jgi:hypothetical protein
MKITIAPVVAGPAWGTDIVLVPGAEFSPENIIINGTNVVDLIHPLRSPTVRIFDRGNRTNSLSFTVTSQNASFLLSEQQLILYTVSLPSFGLVKFYGETALTTPFAYFPAGLKDFKISQIGVASIRTFALDGGVIYTTVPVAPATFP